MAGKLICCHINITLTCNKANPICTQSQAGFEVLKLQKHTVISVFLNYELQINHRTSHSAEQKVYTIGKWGHQVNTNCKNSERKKGEGMRKESGLVETEYSCADEGWKIANPFSQGPQKPCFNCNPQCRRDRHNLNHWFYLSFHSYCTNSQKI